MRQNCRIEADGKQYEKANSDDEHQFKLIESIERNAHHYIEVFSRAVDKVLPPPSREPKYEIHNVASCSTILTWVVSRTTFWTLS
jgi:hypothetical protein